MNIKDIYTDDTDKDLPRAWSRYSAKPITGSHDVTTTETVQISAENQAALARFDVVLSVLKGVAWKTQGELISIPVLKAEMVMSDTSDARVAMQLENLYEELAPQFGSWAYQWPFDVTEYSVTDTETVTDYGQSIAEQCGISTYDQFVEAIR